MLRRLVGRSPEEAAETEPSREGGAPCPSPNCKPSQPTVPEVIELLGTGLYQLRVSFLSGPIWFADGAALLIISGVSNVVASEWGLGAGQRSALMSLLLAGKLFGNVLGGLLSDVCGRKLPILASYFLLFFSSLLSAFSWDFWSLGLLRVLVGASMGIGQPAQQALISEVTPTKWRAAFSILCTGFLFSFGEAFSGLLLLLDDPAMKDVHWRTLVVAVAVPAAVFGLVAFAFLEQSPLFLACSGRYDETRAVLEAMRRDNGASDVGIDFKPQRVLRRGSSALAESGRTLRVVFGADYLTTTLVCITCCLIVNLSFYGSLYAFPLELDAGVGLGATAASSLIYGALMELVGYTSGVILMLYLPRIEAMRYSMLALGLALAAFAVGAPREQGSFLAVFLTMLGYYGTKFFTAIVFVLVYLYASEVYPTAARTTGVAVSIACGRCAAISSSMVYELLTSVFGTYSVFFWLMSALNFVGCLLTLLLTVEPCGQPIADGHGDGVEDTMEVEPPEHGSSRKGAAIRA